jgi:hypothetical protein
MLLINIKYNKILIFFFVIFNFLKVTAKDYDGKVFICANEIGPILEFMIPNFKKNLEEKIFKFKVYESQNRNSFNVREGMIKKQSSPIDDSYYYYKAHSDSHNNQEMLINFEFYPPTHLLFKHQNSQYTDLVCWVDENNTKDNLIND